MRRTLAGPPRPCALEPWPAVTLSHHRPAPLDPGPPWPRLPRSHAPSSRANSKHKKDIKSNPAFRRDFQQMCTRIGVDPLACTSRAMHAAWRLATAAPWSPTPSSRLTLLLRAAPRRVLPRPANHGFWSQLLGVGDFYYKVGPASGDGLFFSLSHSAGLSFALTLTGSASTSPHRTLSSLGFRWSSPV